MRTISGFRVGPLPHGRKRRRVSLSPARRPDEYQRMTGTGAEREAAAEAARRGPLRVVFVAHAFPRGEHDPTGHFLLGLAGALAAEGVEVEALAPGAAALAGLLAAGTWALRRAAAGADLVHAHWWFPGGLQALAAGRRPLVTTMHGTDVRLARSRPLARAACARVLRASAVVTAVSRWLADEGLGLVAVEGQLAGAPVVAAASGGLVDVVRDGDSGRTCAAGEPAALARVVEEVVADPGATARLAEVARRSAIARFGTRAAARAYADAYAEALATGRR